MCKDGACIPGAPAKCDDGNLCTADGCDPASGTCKFVSGGGTCVDSNPCTDEVCDPKLGCTHVANQASCNDGNACTTGDTCASNSCGGVGIQVCDDGKLCTQDSCDPKQGCIYKDNPAACDDGDACTTDTCGAKACLHQAVVCDDGNPCTVDTCSKASGQCQVDAKALDGKTCDADGDGCTLGDACLAGQCKAGAPVACVLPLKTCQQAACQSTGSKTFDCKAIAASDGSPCVGQDACIAEAFCQAGACKLGSTQKLYAVELAAQGAGLQLLAVAAAGDGLWVGGRSVAADQTSAWWLQRLGPGGQALWSKPWQPAVAVAAKSAGIVGLIASAGNLVLAGSAGSEQDGAQLRLVGLAPAANPASAPTVLWDRTHGVTGQDERPERLVALNGGYAVVGRVEAGAKHSGWVARLGATGLLQWSWQGGPAEGGALRALAQQGDGGLLAAGRAVSSAKGRAWLVRLDAQGKEQWQIQHGAQEDQGFEALVALPGGEHMAAGWATVSGQPRLYLQRVDAAGGAVGAAVVGQSPYRVADALGGAGTQLWLAGQAFADPQGDAWLASTDATGHLAWSVEHDAGGAERLAALALMADGGLATVGTLQTGSDPTAAKGWVRRSDPWGRASCGASGVCAAKTALDCADLNGCSDDLCDAKLGCVSQPSGVACSDSDACTSGDVCQGLSCQAGAAVVCDDANACTADSCDKQKGCVHAVLSGAPCPDDSVCTSGEVCQGSSCSVTQKGCDDGDPCTQDLCDAKVGCLNSALPEASPCGAGKACIGGKCLARFANFISCGSANGGSGGTYPQNYALRHDGTVSSWGFAVSGPGNSPVKLVAGLTEIVHMDVGDGGFCAVQLNGEVRCVGLSQSGVFGGLTCENVDNTSPQLIPNLLNVLHIDIAGTFGAAVTKDGKLWQWGANLSGQFGNGTCAACKPMAVEHPTMTGVVAASSGHTIASYAQMLVLKVDGSLWAAGGYANGGYGCDSYGNYKQLGDSLGTPNSTAYVKVAISDKVQSFAVGQGHRCAVDAAGTVWCWGLGSLGQLGDGGKGTQAKPVKVYGLTVKAKSVVAGSDAACALFVNGKVSCWGSNKYGFLGNPAFQESTTPLEVPNLSDVQQLATGKYHVCALRGDGSVWCWGLNGYDNPYADGAFLGVGEISTSVTSPKPVIGTQPQ